MPPFWPVPSFWLNLGLRVLAEGVETKKQLEFLKQHQRSSTKGTNLGKPCSPAKSEFFANNGPSTCIETAHVS